MKRRPILKNSLKALYRDDPDIMQAIDLINFDQVDYHFYKSLFTHIEEDRFWEIDQYLNGDEVMAYHEAVGKAAMSVTSDLANLIELALVNKEVKH